MQKRARRDKIQKIGVGADIDARSETEIEECGEIDDLPRPDANAARLLQHAGWPLSARCDCRALRPHAFSALRQDNCAADFRPLPPYPYRCSPPLCGGGGRAASARSDGKCAGGVSITRHSTPTWERVDKLLCRCWRVALIASPPKSYLSGPSFSTMLLWQEVRRGCDRFSGSLCALGLRWWAAVASAIIVVSISFLCRDAKLIFLLEKPRNPRPPCFQFRVALPCAVP